MNFSPDAESMLRCHRRERAAREAESARRQQRLAVDPVSGLPVARSRWRRN